MTIEITRRETVHEGHSKLFILTLRMPDGRSVRREVEDHGAAVCVLPYDPERRTALVVRQLRAPVLFAAQQEALCEAIAGIIESADPQDCARREAFEEAGLRLGTLEPVGAVWTMPGVSTERMHLYLAVCREADRAGPGGGVDDDEETEVVELALRELAAMADSGRLDDLKTLVLVQTLRLRQPGLFA